MKGNFAPAHQSELFQSETEQALSQIADAVVICSDTGAIEYVNPAFEQITGYAKDELLGSSLGIVKSGFHPRSFYSNLWTRLRAGEVVVEVFVNRRKNGKLYYFEQTISPVRDSMGKIGRYIATGRDITERKRSERALRRYAAEIERSNKELSLFAHALSHDLHEPLRSITSFVHLLAATSNDRLGPESRDYLTSIDEATGRMQSLIDAMLRYSTIRIAPADWESVDANNALNAAVDALIAAVSETGAEVQPDELPQVMGSPSLISLVFQNLISNSIKYRSTEPPRIKVSSVRDGSFQLFIIEDNGVGFDQKDAAKIFAVFERLYSREQIPGTGIGLAICQKIIEQHGGRIWAESEPGRGSKFFFTLPAVPLAG